jgi:DNA invertase Pin-like site-specific DNA recombinase
VILTMRVAVYCRVSTDDQNIKQQVEYLKSWCIREGHTIIKMVADEESGRLPLTERKQFKKLLDLAISDNTFDAIIIYNLDRLTRNWDDVTLIERYFRDNWEKVKLYSVSDPIDLSSASGRLMFRIRMATSCYMPEDMREKQKIGIARAKSEGKYKGRIKGSKNSQIFRRER